MAGLCMMESGLSRNILLEMMSFSIVSLSVLSP